MQGNSTKARVIYSCIKTELTDRIEVNGLTVFVTEQLVITNAARNHA